MPAKRGTRTKADPEDRFRYLVENAFDVILECAVSGRILYVSPNIVDVLGYQPEQIIGTFLVDDLHPEDADRGLESFALAVGDGDRIHTTLRYRNSKGGWRYLEGRGRPYRTPSGKLRVVIIGRDVTSNVDAEENLRNVQQRLELQLRRLPVAVIGWDADGFVTEWNPAAERMFGYLRSEVIGRLAGPLIESVSAAGEPFVQMLETADDGSEPFRVISTNRTKSGDPVVCEWNIVPMHDGRGAMSGVIAIAENISERERARTLEEAAYKDPVTGMPNRRLFDDKLTTAVDSTRRRSDTFAVLYIDIDDFKRINDTHGHHVGDAVLTAVGLRLRVCVRETDVVARLGGDEFGVILTSLEADGYAEEVAERILASLQQPLVAADRIFEVRASIGISKFPDDGADATALERKADAAMYRAKQKGKSTFSL
ncbi:MAG TPA: diguanylate cyclase [Candidatus Eremiobacteraceae bacterium]|nr:diguanylate cyclase [Candidatus Eremiobacteraceae bacterium]